jgi:hypothetical protein
MDVTLNDTHYFHLLKPIIGIDDHIYLLAVIKQPFLGSYCGIEFHIMTKASCKMFSVICY